MGQYVQNSDGTHSQQTVLTGSKAKVITVRNQSIAAGQFYVAADFLSSDGVKKVNASFSSPDTFSNNFYINYRGADDAAFGTSGGGATSKSSGNVSSDAFSGKTRVYFQNADTVSHVISADAVGWPN